MEILAGLPGTLIRRAPLTFLAVLIVSMAPPVSSSTAQSNGGPSCSKQASQKTFERFIYAYNEGNLERLNSLFAKDPKFQWYSTGAPGPRSGEASFQRGTLTRYFRARHDIHDQMTFLSFRFNGRSSRWSDFGFQLNRKADDFNGGSRFVSLGKGAIECSTGRPKIMVMSFGASTPVQSSSELSPSAFSRPEEEGSKASWIPVALVLVGSISASVVGVRRFRNH